MFVINIVHFQTVVVVDNWTPQNNTTRFYISEKGSSASKLYQLVFVQLIQAPVNIIIVHIPKSTAVRINLTLSSTYQFVLKIRPAKNNQRPHTHDTTLDYVGKDKETTPGDLDLLLLALIIHLISNDNNFNFQKLTGRGPR